jgi:hypothetical protein
MAREATTRTPATSLRLIALETLARYRVEGPRWADGARPASLTLRSRGTAIESNPILSWVRSEG